VEGSSFECPLHPGFFLSLLFKPSHSKQEKVQTMSLASLCTDHTSGLVAGAQKDYSQSFKLPKRPSTAEQQEWFPGSQEDVFARTAMALAVGCIRQDSNFLGLQDLPCHPHPALGTCSSDSWLPRRLTCIYLWSKWSQ